MTLHYAGIEYEVREVLLRQKPASMLAYSEKGTVPVWVDGDNVIDESIEIVNLALARRDPDGWLNWTPDVLDETCALIESCESSFKPNLDGYKYADDVERGPAHRANAAVYLQMLEDQLAKTLSPRSPEHFLFGDRLSVADVCLFPFVRQFAHVDKPWFDACELPLLQRWLGALLTSPLFLDVMAKHPQWHEGDPAVLVN